MMLGVYSMKYKSIICVLFISFAVSFASDIESELFSDGEPSDSFGTKSIDHSSSINGTGDVIPNSYSNTASNETFENQSSVSLTVSTPVLGVSHPSLFSSSKNELHLEERLSNNSSLTMSNVESSNRQSEHANRSAQNSVLSPPTAAIPNLNISEDNSTRSFASGSSLQEEQEGVVLVTEKPIPYTKAIFQQTLVWLNDTYTLSILIPVAAGFVFASIVIVSVATCKCIKRRCYRRNLRRKILPDTVKNMRPSDRARLLAETSDEEF